MIKVSALLRPGLRPSRASATLRQKLAFIMGNWIWNISNKKMADKLGIMSCSAPNNKSCQMHGCYPINWSMLLDWTINGIRSVRFGTEIPSLHDGTPTKAVIDDTKETDLVKLGVSTSGLGLPDDLKKVALSIISPSEIQVQVLHSLSGASSRFVTWRNFTVQSLWFY